MLFWLSIDLGAIRNCTSQENVKQNVNHIVINQSLGDKKSAHNMQKCEDICTCPQHLLTLLCPINRQKSNSVSEEDQTSKNQLNIPFIVTA